MVSILHLYTQYMYLLACKYVRENTNQYPVFDWHDPLIKIDMHFTLYSYYILWIHMYTYCIWNLMCSKSQTSETDLSIISLSKLFSFSSSLKTDRNTSRKNILIFNFCGGSYTNNSLEIFLLCFIDHCILMRK